MKIASFEHCVNLTVHSMPLIKADSDKLALPIKAVPKPLLRLKIQALACKRVRLPSNEILNSTLGNSANALTALASVAPMYVVVRMRNCVLDFPVASIAVACFNTSIIFLTPLHVIKLTNISTVSTACNSAMSSCNKEGSLREELNSQGLRKPVTGKIPGISGSCIDRKTCGGCAIKSISNSAFASSLAFFNKVEIKWISAKFFSELLSFDAEISSKSSGNLFNRSLNKYSLFSI